MKELIDILYKEEVRSGKSALTGSKKLKPHEELIKRLLPAGSKLFFPDLPCFLIGEDTGEIYVPTLPDDKTEEGKKTVVVNTRRIDTTDEKFPMTSKYIYIYQIAVIKHTTTDGTLEYLTIRGWDSDLEGKENNMNKLLNILPLTGSAELKPHENLISSLLPEGSKLFFPSTIFFRINKNNGEIIENPSDEGDMFATTINKRITLQNDQNKLPFNLKYIYIYQIIKTIQPNGLVELFIKYCETNLDKKENNFDKLLAVLESNEKNNNSLTGSLELKPHEKLIKDLLNEKSNVFFTDKPSFKINETTGEIIEDKKEIILGEEKISLEEGKFVDVISNKITIDSKGKLPILFKYIYIYQIVKVNTLKDSSSVYIRYYGTNLSLESSDAIKAQSNEHYHKNLLLDITRKNKKADRESFSESLVESTNSKKTVSFTIAENIYEEFSKLADTMAINKSKFVENKIVEFVKKNS